MKTKLTVLLSIIIVLLLLGSCAVVPTSGGGSVKNLNEIGFNNLGKYNIWVSVSDYDFSSKTASFSSGQGVWIYEINPNNHLLYLSFSKTGKLEDKDFYEAYEYSDIDNNSISCGGEVIVIENRSVSPSGKAVVIDASMPYDFLNRHDTSAFRFVPSECIDWSNGVEVEEPTTARTEGNVIHSPYELRPQTVYTFHLK